MHCLTDELHCPCLAIETYGKCQALIFVLDCQKVLQFVIQSHDSLLASDSVYSVWERSTVGLYPSISNIFR